MRYLRTFGRFWWDFVVGDDWRLAAGVAVSIGLTALLAHKDVDAWWLLPVAVAPSEADEGVQPGAGEVGGNDEHCVRDQQEHSAAAARSPASQNERGKGSRGGHGHQLDGPEAEGKRFERHEISTTRGISKPAIWELEAKGISTASLTLPRRAGTTALPCSVAFPTIATMTTATKNSERCAASAKACSVPTSVWVTTAVTSVAMPNTTSAVLNGQPASSGSADE
jgi:hypothetical protein